MLIQNMKDYAQDYKYIVAREVDGAWCFWGAWNDYGKALAAATDIGGQVFPTAECKAA